MVSPIPIVLLEPEFGLTLSQLEVILFSDLHPRTDHLFRDDPRGVVEQFDVVLFDIHDPVVGILVMIRVGCDQSMTFRILEEELVNSSHQMGSVSLIAFGHHLVASPEEEEELVCMFDVVFLFGREFVELQIQLTLFQLEELHQELIGRLLFQKTQHFNGLCDDLTETDHR